MYSTSKHKAMSSLQKLQDKSSQTEFDKKVLGAIQHLHPYVKHRLYIAESKGIIPKNMYHSNGMIDEGIAVLYENGINVDDEALAVKLHLFEIVDGLLDELFEKEAFHTQTMSTNSILEEEMDSLEEVFTVDAGNDFIMQDELTDISYQNEDKHKHIFLYDNNESSIIKAFELEDVSAVDTSKLLGKFYSRAPQRAVDIIDLYVFGKLDHAEIARVKKIDIKGVQKIIKKVRKGFRIQLK